MSLQIFDPCKKLRGKPDLPKRRRVKVTEDFLARLFRVPVSERPAGSGVLDPLPTQQLLTTAAHLFIYNIKIPGYLPFMQDEKFLILNGKILE